MYDTDQKRPETCTSPAEELVWFFSSRGKTKEHSLGSQISMNADGLSDQHLLSQLQSASSAQPPLSLEPFGRTRVTHTLHLSSHFFIQAQVFTK